MTTPISMTRRHELVDTPVTLDGSPARITGARLDFPIIRSTTSSVEFAWPTVARIVDAGGHFHS